MERVSLNNKAKNNDKFHKTEKQHMDCHAKNWRYVSVL